MYWHCGAYSASLAAGPNLDTTAVLDEVITRRNNHFIFTNPMNLLAALPIGALMTRARFGNAALSQLSINHLWPIEVSATIPDLPQLVDFRDFPLELPQNEELTIELSNSGAGPTQSSVVMFLGDPAWTRNFPPHLDRVNPRATVVITAGSETTWTALAEPVFERDLLNGVYAVVGASLVGADALAFRLRFPDQPDVGGKQFRPGALVQNAANLQPNSMFLGGMGEWGRFHTFSPPEVQVLADAAGGTYEMRFQLLYLGKDESLLRR